MNIISHTGCGLGPYLFDPPESWPSQGGLPFTIVALDEHGTPTVQHHPHRWKGVETTVTVKRYSVDDAFEQLEARRKALHRKLYAEAKRHLGPEPKIIEYVVLAHAIQGEDDQRWWSLGKPRKFWVGELRVIMFAIPADADWED